MSRLDFVKTVAGGAVILMMAAWLQELDAIAQATLGVHLGRDPKCFQTITLHLPFAN